MVKKQVSTIEQFEQLAQENSRFLFFKNSLTCPVSSEAYNEYEKFISEHEDVPTFFLHVQEARPLSNYIQEKYGVRHQSPQALLIEDGKVVWHDSHWRITTKSLEEAVIK
ncbi:bacillithiol system redox-active protein YtxJ [Bacillus tianshenii]|nr:bacillithiol system redox-active protein YtxJ [Bacillus tianshenii]